MQSDGNRLCCPQIWRNKKEGKGAPPEARWSVTAMICGAWLPSALILSVLGWYTEEVASKEFHPFTPFSLHWPFLSVLTSHLRYFSLGNVSGANQASFANPSKPNKKSFKKSGKNGSHPLFLEKGRFIPVSAWGLHTTNLCYNLEKSASKELDMRN